MNKIKQLKQLVDEICDDCKNCKNCPIFKQLSPHTYELLCEMISRLKEEE